MFGPSPEMYHGEWHPCKKSWIETMDENFKDGYLENYWADLAVILQGGFFRNLPNL